jgi:hypothetical protein
MRDRWLWPFAYRFLSFRAIPKIWQVSAGAKQKSRPPKGGIVMTRLAVWIAVVGLSLFGTGGARRKRASAHQNGGEVRNLS